MGLGSMLFDAFASKAKQSSTPTSGSSELVTDLEAGAGALGLKWASGDGLIKTGLAGIGLRDAVEGTTGGLKGDLAAVGEVAAGLEVKDVLEKRVFGHGLIGTLASWFGGAVAGVGLEMLREHEIAKNEQQATAKPDTFRNG